jgi:PAS domain S-box-containing protein
LTLYFNSEVKFMPAKVQSIPSLAPKFPLAILCVEDNPVHAELCLEILSGAEFDLTAEVVATREEFVAKLRTGVFDIVLSDYHLGSWTGLEALDAMQEMGLDIPFLLMTSALEERTAIECTRRGITDYVIKSRIDQLPAAIHQALEQRAARVERERAELSLAKAETKLRELAEYIPNAVFIDRGSKCTYVNSAAEAITGYSRIELVRNGFWSLIPESSKSSAEGQRRHARRSDEPVRCRTQIATRWGSERPVEFTIKALEIAGARAELITVVPIVQPHPMSVVPESLRGGVSAS